MLQVFINSYNNYTYNGVADQRDHIKFVTLLRDTITERKLEVKLIKQAEEKKKVEDEKAAATAKAAAENKRMFGIFG